MSENKHQMMCRDLRRIDCALVGLISTIGLSEGIAKIKSDSAIVESAFEDTLNAAYDALRKKNASGGPVVWDTILLGVSGLALRIIHACEGDLRKAMLVNGLETGTKEVIH